MKQRFSCGIQWMPLRENPSEAAECGTMLLYGENYRIIQTLTNENGSVWHHVLCEHDSYAGYISEAYHQLSLEPITPVFPVTKVFHSEFNPMGLVSPGSIIQLESENTRVVSDDRAFLLQYLQTPYLWGGRSIFGIDCSGLSQVYMKIKGVSIPRNASEQAELGETVDFKDRRLGDLAFFHATNSKNPSQVTHVGIILDANEIIHASGMVRIDKLYETGIIRQPDETPTHNLMWIKRFTS